MVDFPALRTKMVDGQVRPNDVTDLRIIDAMGEVAREDFAPEDQKPLAYLDRDLPLGEGRAARGEDIARALALLRRSTALWLLVLFVGGLLSA